MEDEDLEENFPAEDALEEVTKAQSEMRASSPRQRTEERMKEEEEEAEVW